MFAAPGGLVQCHLQEARKRPSGEKGAYPDILVVRDVERKLGTRLLREQ